MRPPRPVAEPPAPPQPGADPDLEQALKKVLAIIYKEHPLNSNQILNLAAELQRLGVHRLVEEHLSKYRRRESSE